MAADFDTGLNTVVTLGAVAYTCVQSAALNRQVREILAVCTGVEQGQPGPASYTLTLSLAIKKTDHAKLTALAQGAKLAVDIAVGGATAGNIHITSTEGVIMQSNVPLNPAGTGYLAIDATIRLNDLTVAAHA